MKSLHLVVGMALVCGGCATAATPTASTTSGNALLEMFGGVSTEKSERIAATVADKPLGSAENPVRAHMPAGQRAYLSRLRCADGKAPRFERTGSAGMSPYGQIVDAYQVTCPGSSPASSRIFIDMYHPTHIETEPTPGFTIVAP